MGYSGYIKVNGETVMNEYKSSGDIILTYAKAMLLSMPTTLKCGNIVKLVEDFHHIDDCVVEYDLGLQTGSALYKKIYIDKCYADAEVVGFITGLMGKIAEEYPAAAELFSYLSANYQVIAEGKQITMTVDKKDDIYRLTFSDGNKATVPCNMISKNPILPSRKESSFDLCALYDNCSALSVEFNITDKEAVAKALLALDSIPEGNRNKALEGELQNSLKDIENLEIYAGY